MPSHRIKAAFAFAVALALPAVAPAYERDVHFGLTWWLAMQAGFGRSHAEAIAVADARIDGGMLETQALMPEYACFGRFAQVAQEVQQRHYPAPRSVPAAPAERQIVAGGPAARRALDALMPTVAGKEHLLLGKLGEALHPLQDSYAHQGVPAALPALGGVACDVTLASARPAPRGGPASHAADLTASDVAATLAMARATYDALLAWPPIHGQPRRAADWSTLAPQVETYARAATKSTKRAWLTQRGRDATDFLQGISLPDGVEPGPPPWTLHKMPDLVHVESTQHEIAPETRLFFDRLLVRWLGPEPVEAVVADAAGRASVKPDAALRELTARMKLWKLADHGAAAELAHAPAPLSAGQLSRLDRLTRAPGGFIRTTSVGDALYPLLTLGPNASPLLPFIVRELPPRDGVARAVALLRLRHAPYDTLVWFAERRDGRLQLVDVQATIEP